MPPSAFNRDESVRLSDLAKGAFRHWLAPRYRLVGLTDLSRTKHLGLLQAWRIFSLLE
jgi:hypothetical protein